jgi:hypothetical protein
MANLKLKNPSGGSLNLVSADGVSDLTVTFPATTGTAMVSGNMPAFSAYPSENSAMLTSAAYTKVVFNTEEFDTNSNFDSTTNYRFTPTVAGYYMVTGSIYYTYDTTPPTLIQATIYKNGSLFKSQQMLIVAASLYGTQTVSSIIYFNGTTDYVELYARQGSGVNCYVLAGSNNTYFSGSMVRSA